MRGVAAVAPYGATKRSMHIAPTYFGWQKGSVMLHGRHTVQRMPLQSKDLLGFGPHAEIMSESFWLMMVTHS